MTDSLQPCYTLLGWALNERIDVRIHVERNRPPKIHVFEVHGADAAQPTFIYGVFGHLPAIHNILHLHGVPTDYDVGQQSMRC